MIDPVGLAGAARACGQISAGLARSFVAGVRVGRDQAAALRSAALSCDRHPDRGRYRCTRAVAEALPRVGHDLVVYRSGAGGWFGHHPPPDASPALPVVVVALV